MISVTKYVLLNLLKNNGSVSVSEVEDVLTVKIPTICNIIANSTPYEIVSEVKTSVKQLNLYTSKHGCGHCFSFDNNTVMMRKVGCCRDILGRLLDSYKEVIHRDSLSSLILRLIDDCLIKIGVKEDM